MMHNAQAYNTFIAYLQSDTIQEKLKENWRLDDLSRLFNDFASEKIRHLVTYKGLQRLADLFISVNNRSIKEKEADFKEWLDETLRLILTDLFNAEGSINMDLLKALDYENKLSIQIVKHNMDIVKTRLVHTYIEFIGEEIHELLRSKLGDEKIAEEIDHIEDPTFHTMTIFKREFDKLEPKAIECIESRNRSLCQRRIFLEDNAKATQACNAYDLIQQYKADILNGKAEFIHFQKPISDAPFAWVTMTPHGDDIVPGIKLPVRIPSYAYQQLLIIYKLEKQGLDQAHPDWQEAWKEITTINAAERNKLKLPGSLEEHRRRQQCYAESASGNAHQNVMLLLQAILDSMQPKKLDNNFVFASYTSVDGKKHKGYITVVQQQQLERIKTAIKGTDNGKMKRSEFWFHAWTDINNIYDRAFAANSINQSPPTKRN